MSTRDENRILKIISDAEYAFIEARRITVNEGYSRQSNQSVTVNFEVNGKQSICTVDPTDFDKAVQELYHHLLYVTALRTYMVYGSADNIPQTLGEYIGAWNDEPKTHSLLSRYPQYEFLKIAELINGMPHVMKIHSLNSPTIIQEMSSKNNYESEQS